MAGEEVQGKTPPGVNPVGIYDPSGLDRLKLSLDIYNEWRLREGMVPFKLADISLPENLPSDPASQNPGQEDPGENLLKNRLEWFQKEVPGAFFAAALSQAGPGERAELALAARLEGLKILPPLVPAKYPFFILEDRETIRVGLVALFGWEKALELTSLPPPITLEEFVKTFPLDEEQMEKLAWAGALDNFGPREALAAAANRITEEGNKWRRAEKDRLDRKNNSGKEKISSVGQLSLFDLFAAEDPGSSPEPVFALFELPQTPPVSRLEYLLKQFQTLSFYTAEHPLWEVPISNLAETSRSEVIPLGEISTKIEVGGEGKTIILSGLVLAVRHLPFTEEDGNGQELTIVRLEDWTGKVELLIPPEMIFSFELEEGIGVTAQARPLGTENKPGEKERPFLLIAEALAVYPPPAGFGAVSAKEDLTGLENEAGRSSQSGELEGPGQAGSNPDDETWSNSLFETFDAGIKEVKPPPLKSNSEPFRGKGQGKGANGGKEKREPRPNSRHLHIDLHLTGEGSSDDEMMAKVKDLLRQHSGEDVIHLYLHWPESKPVHLEPQSLTVAYNPDFANSLVQLLGGNPELVRVEERPG